MADPGPADRSTNAGLGGDRGQRPSGRAVPSGARPGPGRPAAGIWDGSDRMALAAGYPASDRDAGDDARRPERAGCPMSRRDDGDAAAAAMAGVVALAVAAAMVVALY